MSGWEHRHIGRSFVGHHLEDECPCPQEPCGLVDAAKADPNCPQHPVSAGKTIRQSHLPESCPMNDQLETKVFPAIEAPTRELPID